MSTINVKKTLFFLVIILFSLVVVIFVISRLSVKNKNSIENKNEGASVYKTNSIPINKINISPTSVILQTKFGFKSPLSLSEIAKLEKLIQLLPFENDDFKVVYSALLNKYFILKKSSLSDEKIAKWAKENGITELVNNKEFFVIIENELLIVQAEKNFEKNKQELINNPVIVSSTSSNLNNQAKNISLLVDFMNILLSGFSSTATGSPIPKSTKPYSASTTNVNFGSVPTSLSSVFQEVSQKVGIPEKILEGTMRIEYPSTFSLSPTEIGAYSTPGNSLPDCIPNACSATGPMQMTTGIDSNGQNSCLECGLKSCPNAWGGFGGAVNSFGGYSHSPNPCNIKDNVYGAGAKLKHDSGAKGSDNWTQEQVYRAAERYYGSCLDNFRYERLGNRTYCEFLWWYYKPSAFSGRGEQSKTYYPQCGGNYDNIALPSGCNVCDSGCGPTTIAMILSTYLGTSYNPEAVVQLYKDNNYYLGCEGSRITDAKSLVENLGLKTSDYLIYDKATIDNAAQDFKDYINNGWTIFTAAEYPKGNAHFFWITNIDENNDTWAYDPYYGRFQQPPFNEKSYYPYPQYQIAFAVKK